MMVNSAIYLENFGYWLANGEFPLYAVTIFFFSWRRWYPYATLIHRESESESMDALVERLEKSMDCHDPVIIIRSFHLGELMSAWINTGYIIRDISSILSLSSLVVSSFRKGLIPETLAATGFGLQLIHGYLWGCDRLSEYAIQPRNKLTKQESFKEIDEVKNQTNPLTIEATGYGPYIHARAARATQKGKGVHLTKAEKDAQMIRDYWVRQDFLKGIQDYAANHHRDLFRNRWECAADKKGLYSRVQWEVDKVTAKMDEELEKRRSRLAELLKSEEDMYLKESLSPHEDEETKTSRMLCRYKELKMQKEAERQKLAEEKKEQQFK
ncbi:hypothetical protein HNY73_018899 [Argiope bruennichi]|uniref:Uncharacterized protein n=1 Tax=Argiope bruennichi TaxID=94029 RepID=A0A8T0EF05_ARGBR|nr:hypothetical protein HNY73_018899 [Argiope bruennichi]